MIKMRFFKYLLLVLLPLTVSVTVRAQSPYNGNVFDLETVATMEAVYDSQYLIEKATADSLKEINKKYAEIAALTATGIYLSKYNDAQALRDLTFWNDARENYYYKKIYGTALNILSRTVRVTQMCLKEPGSALYWGSYIMQVCYEVKTLCSQFQSIVSNSTLSFDDLPFIQFTQNLQQLFNLSKNAFQNINGQTFDVMMDAFVSEIGGGLTEEDLKLDWENLKDLGVGLAASSMGDDARNILVECASIGILQENTAKFIPLIDNIKNFTSDWADPITKLHSVIGTKASINDVLITTSMEKAAWLTDYFVETPEYETKDFYRQTAKISYSLNVWSGSYTDEEVKRFRSLLPKGSYIYDSKDMDWDVFNEEIEKKALSAIYEIDDKEFKKAHESGDVVIWYGVDYGPKEYYTEKTEKEKKKTYANVSKVLINLTCQDTIDVEQGSDAWYCKKCGTNLKDHAHECSMQTSVDASEEEEGRKNRQSLVDMITSKNKEISELEKQYASLEKEKKELEKTKPFTEEVSNAYYVKETACNEMKNRLLQAYMELNELNEALSNFDANNNSSANDKYERIPYIMSKLANQYGLEWLDEGHWENNDFVRQCKSYSKGNYTLVFVAKLRMVRKPTWILGIKNLSARIGVEWKLKAQGESSTTIDVVEIDPEKTDAQNQRIIDERVHEIEEEYRKNHESNDMDFQQCHVTTQEVKTPDDIPQSDDQDTYHLLWHSDRLEIARKIEVRLLKLNGDLMNLERYLHYKHSILDWFLDKTLHRIRGDRTYDSDRKRRIGQNAIQHWMESSGSKKYQNVDSIL